MDAGLFIDLGKVHITTKCLKRCCEIDACDLVYLEGGRCYAVNCYNSELCQPVEAFAIGRDIPSVYYVTRNGKSILIEGEFQIVRIYIPEFKIFVDSECSIERKKWL